MPSQFPTKTIYQPQFKVSNDGTAFRVSADTKFYIHENTVSCDTDAAAYIAYIKAGGATPTAGQEQAICDFVSSAKRYDYWKDLVGVWLPVWGKQLYFPYAALDAANGANLINPLANDLTINSMGTNNPGNSTVGGGLTAQGSQNSFIASSISPDAAGLTSTNSLYSMATSFDVKAHGGAGGGNPDEIDLGVFLLPPVSQWLSMSLNRNGYFVFEYGASSASVSVGSASSHYHYPSELWTVNKHPDSNSGALNLLQDDQVKHTDSAAIPVPQNEIYFGAGNYGGNDYLNAIENTYTFFCIGKGVSNPVQYAKDVNTLLSKITKPGGPPS